MRQKQKKKVMRFIIVIVIIFICVSGSGLYLGIRYISSQLLITNENMAIDMAQLVKNNFSITDEEVAYMKSLSFNEMEVDPINLRLMDVGNGVKLNSDITNVYIIAPLSEDEIKYTTDGATSEFFGYEDGTKLDGVWLLNGIIDDDGKFVATEREDIYRYTLLTPIQIKGMEERKAFAELSEDAWGKFITGYTPIFTEEGSFVGLLGIDMNPDRYQASVQKMIFTLITILCVIALALIFLFLFFYFKYIKAKEGQLYFDFYSRMSHDMRTPMNAILGLVALSEEENDLDVLHKNLDYIEESGRYMLRLINDTLDVQKLDAGKLKLDPKIRCCGDVMQNIITMMKSNAESKNIDFKVVNKGVSDECYCYIDEIRIQQVFMNLATNAVKFTPEAGKIQFTMECLGVNDRTHHLKFEMIDSGIGMSAKFIKEELFHPFAQEQDSVTTQYGGSGLGLSIVKQLVNLMNGQIEVESELGKGTKFVVYLDIEEATAEEVEGVKFQVEQKERISMDAIRGIKILLCEDHPLNAEIAERLLEKYGCTVVVACNGKEAVDKLSKSSIGEYDVILMDIRMPIMDGITATKAIRALERADAKTITILAMTANAYEEDKNKCKAAGMNGHIAKPIDPENMYQTIAEHISKKRTKIKLGES